MRGLMGCKTGGAVNWRLPSKNEGVAMLKDRKWWCSDNEIFEIQILEMVYCWLLPWPRIPKVQGTFELLKVTKYHIYYKLLWLYLLIVTTIVIKTDI